MVNLQIFLSLKIDFCRLHSYIQTLSQLSKTAKCAQDVETFIESQNQMRASFSLCSAAQTHNPQITLDHVSLQLLTNPRGQDFHHLSAFPQKIPHSSGFISVYQLCADMQREEEEEDRETGLTYDETESPGGGQQWPVAMGRNHPRGVYI